MKITITLFLAPATDWPSPIAVFPERLWQETEWDFVFVCMLGGPVCVRVRVLRATLSQDELLSTHTYGFGPRLDLFLPPFPLCNFFFLI